MLEPIPLRNPKTMALQIRDAVVELIGRKNLGVGDQLPTEAALCAAFGISRPSLREALRLLEQEGLIITRHGSGRFVSAAATLEVARPITSYESISGMLAALGYTPQTKILSVTEAAAADHPQAAKALALEDDDRVVVIERLRCEGGTPLVYSLAVIPGVLLPDRTPVRLAGSLNDILAGQGMKPTMSSANAAAVVLPDDLSAKIGAAPGAPWLLVTETCITPEGKPVLHGCDWHSGDLISFNFTRR